MPLDHALVCQCIFFFSFAVKILSNGELRNNESHQVSQSYIQREERASKLKQFKEQGRIAQGILLLLFDNQKVLQA
jgi:hypothetical protein